MTGAPESLFGQLLQEDRRLDHLDLDVALSRAGHPLSETEERDRARIRAELGKARAGR